VHTQAALNVGLSPEEIVEVFLDGAGYWSASCTFGTKSEFTMRGLQRGKQY
jgi:hypothetical protein